jgi:hypothetical protein
MEQAGSSARLNKRPFVKELSDPQAMGLRETSTAQEKALAYQKA